MLRHVFMRRMFIEVVRTFFLCLVTINIFHAVILASTCLQDETVQSGKYLNGSTFTQLPHSSLYSCAGACYAFVFCRSFNFYKQTKTCFLNFANETQGVYYIKANTDFIYSRIEDWPKGVAGPCREHFCKKEEQCMVTRRNSAICVPSPSYEIHYRVDFVLSSEKRTWDDSVAECTRMYGSLAVVDTKKKSDAVEKMITDQGLTSVFWLGATEAGHAGSWMWVDGQNMTFNMWSEKHNQPRDSGVKEECLTVTYGYMISTHNKLWGWYDRSYDAEYHYICEMIVHI